MGIRQYRVNRQLYRNNPRRQHTWDAELVNLKAVYRNLRARGVADTWTVANAHEYKGNVIIDKGVTHNVEFGLTHLITTKAESVAKGCARIERVKERSVVAAIGGTITTEKPTTEKLGRLTLNISAGAFQVITQSGSKAPFIPSQSIIWFGASGAAVYNAN
jgi:hypothetical protein